MIPPIQSDSVKSWIIFWPDYLAGAISASDLYTYEVELNAVSDSPIPLPELLGTNRQTYSRLVSFMWPIRF